MLGKVYYKHCKISQYMGSAKVWSVEEIEELKSLANKRIQAKVIADRLGRSESAVRTQLSRLKSALKAWMPEEENFLIKSIHEGKRYSEIAEVLKRSYFSVVNKAHKLGLTFFCLTEPRLRMSDFSEVEKAYLAGFLDGEGAFMILKNKNRRGDGFWFCPSIFVANTNAEVIEWIQSKIRFGSLSHKKQKRNKRASLVFKIQRPADVIEVVNGMEPYLKVKKQQANLLREWCREKIKVGYFRPPSNKMMEIYKKLKELNKRGTLERCAEKV
jgi:hypothetical protein